jgi:aminoglycoside 2'-N-acetyltransferase I
MPTGELQIAHTASLRAGELRAIRALLDAAFGGDFSDDDWEHALGGLHAVVWEGDAPIAHGAVVMRRLLHAGRALRTGYVEAVAVRADRRRRGHGNAIMEGLERVVRAAYELGALSASDPGAELYAARGWRRWTGRAWVIAPDGLRRTEGDEGSIHVLPVGVDLSPEVDLACDWRDGEVW